MRKFRLAIVVTAVVMMMVIPIIAFLFIAAPAQLRYNRLFGAHVIMAYDQANFEGMEEQVNNVWRQMNQTFAGFDLDTTYNTPWFWEQTYDNSLKAQQDYFSRLIQRIEMYKTQWENLKKNPGAIVLTDWYDQAIRNLRDEMKREGGLDWAIRDAWYLNFAPTAYWLLWWMIPIEVVLLVLALAFAFRE